MSSPIISADSDVTEPRPAYVDNIDPAFRDRAPHLEHVEGAGDMFVIEADDFPGRIAGSQIGIAAYDKAQQYFSGTVGP